MCARSFGVCSSLAIACGRFRYLDSIQSRRAHNAGLPLSFRGIGHGLVKKFLERSNRVIATARVPQDAQQLQQLAASNSNLTVAALDISSPKSILDFAAEVKKHTSHVDVSGSKLAGGVRATSRCMRGGCKTVVAMRNHQLV